MSNSVKYEDDISGKWIYIRKGAGGRGMNPNNAGMIFLGCRTAKYRSFGVRTVVETYRYSNPESVESRGGYHDPDERVQQCDIAHCRYATKEEIRNLNKNKFPVTEDVRGICK